MASSRLSAFAAFAPQAARTSEARMPTTSTLYSFFMRNLLRLFCESNFVLDHLQNKIPSRTTSSHKLHIMLSIDYFGQLCKRIGKIVVFQIYCSWEWIG